MARHSVFVASRAAVLELFGADGLKQISELVPVEIKRAIVDSPLIAGDWLPERWVIAWQEAVWRGPAGESKDRFDEFCRRTVHQGFGRVRKVLLSLVTPAQMFPRSAELWRHEHTTGELTVRVDAGAKTALLRLTDHPYANHALAARVLAESLRYAASLARTAGVDESHSLRGGALEVRLDWR